HGGTGGQRHLTVHIGPLGPEHAGEAFTVQRAAYVTEAQQYRAPDLPPLTETLDELRGDPAPGRPPPRARRGAPVAPALHRRGLGGRLLDAVEAAAPPAVRTLWLATGVTSEASLALYRRAG